MHVLTDIVALSNLDISDLVAMDNTYVDRLKLRRSVLDAHPEATKQCRSVAEPAVLELYEWMVSTYLPQRFPTIYKPITTASGERQLYNCVAKTAIPIRPRSPMSALDDLGEHVDTDFLVLLPSSTASDGSPIYHLEAVSISYNRVGIVSTMHDVDSTPVCNMLPCWLQYTRQLWQAARLHTQAGPRL